MGNRHFRAGVVTVVGRDDGRILAFERMDVPGNWQLPQGGLNSGEEPTEAAWRELGEETGLGPDDVELISSPPDWVLYEWPFDVVAGGARLGQVQRWFFFRIRDDTTEPTPDGREFRDWKWTEPAWLVEHVVAFRRPGYARMLGEGQGPRPGGRLGEPIGEVTP